MEDLRRIQALIAAIPFEDDEADQAAMDDVVEQARRLDDPRRVVPMLFRWMEQQGHRDLGSPGPFVHFIEEDMDYVSELEASLSAKPIGMTVWMANRIANAETDAADIRRWIGLLEPVLSHPDADAQCRDDAHDFINHQSARLQR
jgi:hypothetical protein